MVPSGRKDFPLLLSTHKGSGTRRASYSVGTWVIPRGKAAEATHLHLVQWLRMVGSIPSSSYMPSWFAYGLFVLLP